ncbi:sugar phosphate nucleotidyltransferase [Salisaeta longa]|uniref:sugar phosphate nucleotidyltransferase n=1 Tax=Salisaeta longa TaxID=503170 RepID=UPI0003B30F14|nr:sugar phosphate nucleotidyltransferase [Salisaeta longa]
MKLIVPMAGRGTRVRPHSHVTPKPLLKVKGRSIVERIVDTFAEVLPSPPDEGVFVLGPDFGQEIRDQLTQICEARDMSAHFAVQKEALGTAHAVGCAGDHLSGEGIVVFADTLFGITDDVSLGAADVVVWVKHVEDPSRFGVAVREGEEVVRLVEKPDEPISNEAIIGIYYVNDLSGLQREIQYLIDHDVRGKGDEFQLTDAFDRLLQDGKVFHTASVDAWMDCGTIPALLETTGRILERETDDLHQGTVHNSIIHDPVYIGPGATIDGAVVGPNVSVEAGATIKDSIVQDSIVFRKGRVENAVLHDSIVGRHATAKNTTGRVNIGDHSSVG